MAPPLLGYSLLLPLPPSKRDKPNGLGRRKVPDKRVLTLQGIATIPMQIYGMITLECREIRHYLALDKPSQVVTRGRERSCLLHGVAGCAGSSMHLL